MSPAAAKTQQPLSLERLLKVLTAAKDALRSYQYRNASEELAKGIADMCDDTLAQADARRFMLLAIVPRSRPNEEADVPEGMVIVDVWGGERSTFHMARFLTALDEAWPLVRQEMAEGFLVNLRLESGWRGFANFDLRLSRPNEGVSDR